MWNVWKQGNISEPAVSKKIYKTVTDKRQRQQRARNEKLISDWLLIKYPSWYCLLHQWVKTNYFKNTQSRCWSCFPTRHTSLAAYGATHKIQTCHIDPQYSLLHSARLPPFPSELSHWLLHVRYQYALQTLTCCLFLVFPLTLPSVALVLQLPQSGTHSHLSFITLPVFLYRYFLAPA